MNPMMISKGQPQSTVDFRIPLRKNFRDKILQFKEKDNKTYKEIFIVYCQYKKYVPDSRTVQAGPTEDKNSNYSSFSGLAISLAAKNFNSFQYHGGYGPLLIV